MNASGQVTGQAALNNGSLHAFLFDGHSMRDLGTFGGSRSLGSAINDSGWVTGFAVKRPMMQVRMRSCGTVEGCGTLARWVAGISEGNAINAAGHVAGLS